MATPPPTAATLTMQYQQAKDTARRLEQQVHVLGERVRQARSGITKHSADARALLAQHGVAVHPSANDTEVMAELKALQARLEAGHQTLATEALQLAATVQAKLDELDRAMAAGGVQ